MRLLATTVRSVYSLAARQASGLAVDLRSDTVTRPCTGMRSAMAVATVGDDVYGEDPTTAQLEERVAALLGMEGGLLLPTGTMANLVAVMTHCGRGDQAVLGVDSHLARWEQGGPAQFGGVVSRVVANKRDGTFCLSEVQAELQEEPDIHAAATRLVCTENTHCGVGGLPLPLAWLQEVAALCEQHDTKLHCDGARLLHSATALNLPPALLLSGHTSATICLSKALGCPAGSVLAGSREFIKRACRLRKGLGGGMRQSGRKSYIEHTALTYYGQRMGRNVTQLVLTSCLIPTVQCDVDSDGTGLTAGVLSAAGLWALDHVYPVLGAEHEKTVRLASVVEEAGGGVVTADPPTTNILLLRLARPAELVSRLARARPSVLALAWDTNTVRLVLHRDVTQQAMQLAEQTLTTVLKQYHNDFKLHTMNY